MHRVVSSSLLLVTCAGTVVAATVPAQAISPPTVREAALSRAKFEHRSSRERGEGWQADRRGDDGPDLAVI